jgi:hypothetical protein
MQQHWMSLVSEIAEIISIDAFVFSGHKTGNYGKHKADGLTLMFGCLMTNKKPYAIFNVDLTRARTTRHGVAGSALPKGQFRPGRGSKFYEFYTQTGVEPPKRLSTFHEHMGKLRTLVFTGEYVKHERLQKDTLRPLDVSCDELVSLALRMTDKTSTTSRQCPDNSPTISLDKQSPEIKIARGFQRFSTTGDSSYGNTLQGSAVTR